MARILAWGKAGCCAFAAVGALLHKPGTQVAWLVPDFSTITRRHKHLQVAIPYRGRNEALHRLVDSTGVKMLGEGELKTKKHGAVYRKKC